MSFPPPPFGTIWQMSTWYWVSRTLHAITEIGVPDALGAEPQTAEALAATVGADPDALFRTVRLLASHQIFEITADGKIGHTPASEILKKDHPTSMRGFVRVMGTEILWNTYGHLEHAIRTGKPAVYEVEPEGFWGYLSAHPEVAGIFADAMEAKAGPQIAALLDAYEWSKFKRIADVGGGRGHLLRAILDTAPDTKGVLFELPHVIEEVRGSASDRLELQAGDFFEGGLPSCDAYICMQVLHDWDDASAEKILQSVAAAAPDGATVLVVETILPTSNTEPHLATLLDIQMLATHKGRERTQDGYAELLRSAGLRFDRLVPSRSDVQILEATKV